MPDVVVSSGCYVYGIVAAADTCPVQCPGVDDAPVVFLESSGLAAAVSPHDGGRQISLRADLSAHTRVLDFLAARVTVVPMAFGTVTEDAATVVESILEPGAKALGELLDVLTGSAQFNLRALYHRDRVLSDLVLADPQLTELHRRTRDLPQDQPQPELIRMGERVAAALERQRAHDSDLVLGAVAPFLVDMRDRVNGDMDQVFDVALLVPEERRSQVESLLEEIAESEQDRMRLQLTGPFPPYDFVEASPWVS